MVMAALCAARTAIAQHAGGLTKLRHPAEVAAWRMNTSVDRIDGTRSYTLERRGLRPIPGRFSASAAWLFIKCKRDTASPAVVVFVDVGQIVDFDSDDRVIIRYRIDQQQPDTGKWISSATREGVYAYPSIDFIHSVAQGRRLLFEVPLYAAAAAVAEFDVTGLRATLPAFLQACGFGQGRARSSDSQ
jgi:hypothetical protein